MFDERITQNIVGEAEINPSLVIADIVFKPAENQAQGLDYLNKLRACYKLNPGANNLMQLMEDVAGSRYQLQQKVGYIGLALVSELIREIRILRGDEIVTKDEWIQMETDRQIVRGLGLDFVHDSQDDSTPIYNLSELLRKTQFRRAHEITDQGYQALIDQHSPESLIAKNQEEKRVIPEYAASQGAVAYIGGGASGDGYLLRQKDGSFRFGKFLKTASDQDKSWSEQSLYNESDCLKSLVDYQIRNNLLVNGKAVTPVLDRIGAITTGSEGNRSILGNVLLMSLAEGVPINEFTVSRQILPDEDNLEIIRQTLIAMQACHDGLDRSMRDLHVQDIVWDRDKRKVTVIDWNVLGGDKNARGDLLPVEKDKDLIKAGVILYSLLTGKPVRYEDEEIKKVDLSKVRNIRARSILEKALNPDPTKRFQSAKEFREAIDHVQFT